MSSAQKRLVEIFTYDMAIADIQSEQQPFRAGARLWATNGRILVALPDDGTPALDTPDKWKKALPLIDGAPELKATINLSCLRAFAGKHDSAEPDCAECLGSGYGEIFESVECEHCHAETRLPCRRCGGDGRDVVPTREGRIDGSRFNLNLIAYGLSFVPDEEVKIGRIGAAAKSRYGELALSIDGEAWRVVVMPMVPSNDQTIPAFSLVTA